MGHTFDWQCSNCGRHKFENHKCMSKYSIICEETAVTDGKGFGFSHKEAAEDWAESYDPHNDMCIASGNEYMIVVEDDQGVQKTFRIKAYSIIHYRAIEEES